MGLVDREPGAKKAFSMDQWPGYEVCRKRVLSTIAERKLTNVVVNTGDIHSSWVNDLAVDPFNSKSPVVATEFVGTSISSGGDGTDMPQRVADAMPDNPRTRFFNGRRGYVRCTLTPTLWTSDYRTVEYVAKPGAPIGNKASYVVEKGKPGAAKA